MQTDDDGMRCRCMTFWTKRKCEEESIPMRGAYLMRIERVDGEAFELDIVSTARALEWIRNLDPAEVNLLIADGENSALPDLIAEGAPLLH